MLGLFRRKERSPDETCPRCGSYKSATMQTCTSCAVRRSGEATGRGLPGEGRWRDEPAATAPGPRPMPPSFERAAGTAAGGAPSAPGAYPHRAKQGVWVRTEAEQACADFLFDNGILFAYEFQVDRHHPAFVIPEKHVAIDRSDGGDAKERHAALTALGYRVIPLPEKDVASTLRTRLGAYFAGKSWKL